MLFELTVLLGLGYVAHKWVNTLQLKTVIEWITASPYYGMRNVYPIVTRQKENGKYIVIGYLFDDKKRQIVDMCGWSVGMVDENLHELESGAVLDISEY